MVRNWLSSNLVSHVCRRPISKTSIYSLNLVKALDIVYLYHLREKNLGIRAVNAVNDVWNWIRSKPVL